MARTLTYAVTGMSCAHCKAAVTTALLEVASVDAVDVDLEMKEVVVTGEVLEDAALRAAIVEVGYEAS